MVWASGKRVLPSACPDLVSGYADLFGWLSVVQCEAAVTRLWGVLRGWVHRPWKIVAADGGARL